MPLFAPVPLRAVLTVQINKPAVLFTPIQTSKEKTGNSKTKWYDICIYKSHKYHIIPFLYSLL